MQDVYLVDALGSYLGDMPCECLTLDNLAQLVTPTLGHLLRVVEQRMVEIGRKDYRSGKYRACETAASRLIASRLYKFALKCGL